VTGAGVIHWQDATLYLSEALKGQIVGLARRDDGDWAVRFRNFDVAVLDQKQRPFAMCPVAEAFAHHDSARPPEEDLAFALLAGPGVEALQATALVFTKACFSCLSRQPELNVKQSDF
jgi:hypothetical protein